MSIGTKPSIGRMYWRSFLPHVAGYMAIKPKLLLGARWLGLIIAAATGSTVAHAAPPALLMRGWIQGTGEIRVYRKLEDLGHLYDQSCISGLLTRRRLLSMHMNNQFVAVYGSRMSDAALADMVAKGIGVGVENYCGGPEIFVIERVVVLKQK